MSYAPFPLIELSGQPYERGVAYVRPWDELTNTMTTSKDIKEG